MKNRLPTAARPWIKVCGVRSLADLEACASAGATHVGINTWPNTPRFVPPKAAASLVEQARRLGLESVLLYVPGCALKMEAALRLHPDFLQTRERPSAALAASLADAGVSLIESRPASRGALPALSWGDVLLLDTPASRAEGGTGRTFRWDLCAGAPRPFLLAGGLDRHNVGAAIREACPAGVDAASGLESSPGVKDPERIRAFCAAARGAFQEIAHAL